MLSTVMMLAMALLSANSSSSDERPASRNSDARIGSGSDDALRRLAIEPLEVGRTYEALAVKDKSERMGAYAELAGPMRAAVWNHQLLVALAEHPEFTEEQRAVLYDAIELFTPEFFEITFDSPDWSSRVDQPLRKLESRAKATLGIVLTAQLFAQLGPDNPRVTVQQMSAKSSPPTQAKKGFQNSGKLRSAPNDLPNCSCSTTSDFCAATWGPDWYCLGGGCVWGTNWGCGSAFAYPCNGLCDLRKFQD